ncbi:techylectin-like protein [Mya arenaria]|uniref:techylectin-like protein n=1 Tax=Mya arenaria TaxID=6604 RepID=UPI0022E67885|nr:techylectin-like protein [Mya arenaria]XP_052818263.1 techylectin-like protein [Mya arenaria]
MHLQHSTCTLLCLTICNVVIIIGQCSARDTVDNASTCRIGILKEMMENATISAIEKYFARTQTTTSSPVASLPRDCLDVLGEGKIVSDLYPVYPDGTETNGFDVRCDMDTGAGGWTLIQRRVSDTDFYKSWNEYKEGFGDLHTNFWLGNDNIVALCRSVSCELRIDMQIGDSRRYAEYGYFAMEDEDRNYKLHVSEYTGTAGNAFASRQNNQNFSTYDRDNDAYSGNCAQLYHGAWWYDACHVSNLNGDYGNTAYAKGLTWNPWTGYYASLSMTEMKVRRVPEK